MELKQEKVKKPIKFLKTVKATGPEGLAPEMIKYDPKILYIV